MKVSLNFCYAINITTVVLVNTGQEDVSSVLKVHSIIKFNFPISFLTGGMLTNLLFVRLGRTQKTMTKVGLFYSDT